MNGLRTALVAAGVCLLTVGCAQFGSGEDELGQAGREPAVRAVPTVLLVDSSASMGEEDAPGPRIDAARQAASALMQALPEGTPTALVTYGANTDDLPESQPRSCEDITVLRPLAPMGDDGAVGAEIDAAIEGLSPGGFTPIGRALEVAAAEFAGADADGEKSIVLISDGEDTCGDPTPCEAARSIAQEHPEIVISTIGFKSDVDELACVARESGGLYLTADNVDQLVTRVVAAQNAPAGASALTATGRSGIELGRHFDDIRRDHPDFRGQAEGTIEDGFTVIRWVDCDWVFDSAGTLVEIRDQQGATIDGVAVGDPVERARSLYGEPVETSSDADGRAVVTFPASREAGTAWRITLDSDDVIRSIALCRCLPGGGAPSSGSQGVPDAVPDWAREPGAHAIEILRAVDVDGVVQQGWQVVSGNFSCDRSSRGLVPSISAVEAGTVECSSITAAVARNCWPDESGHNALCLQDPFSRTLTRIPSPHQLTGQPPEADARVIGIELANGQKCRTVFGGAGSVLREGGQSFNSRFACPDGVVYEGHQPGGFSSDGSGLTATYSTDGTSADQVGVVTLYFLGTA